MHPAMWFENNITNLTMISWFRRNQVESNSNQKEHIVDRQRSTKQLGRRESQEKNYFILQTLTPFKIHFCGKWAERTPSKWGFDLSKNLNGIFNCLTSHNLCSMQTRIVKRCLGLKSFHIRITDKDQVKCAYWGRVQIKICVCTFRKKMWKQMSAKYSLAQNLDKNKKDPFTFKMV